jgi:alkylhydroperoxidase family enzyme
MRLLILDRGHRLRARLAISLVPRLTGAKLDDVALTSLYRPELFGRPWLALVRQVMRGPSDWSAGERELLAAFVSGLNECHYCVGIHTELASIELRRPIGQGGAILSTASTLTWSQDVELEPKVRAACALIAAIRTSDDRADAAMAAALRAGLTRDAIEDSLAVAFVFDLVNRLADAFGYSFGDEAGRKAEARALHRLAYEVPAFLLA